jgi:DNA-binding MarR family transcriptional regulator
MPPRPPRKPDEAIDALLGVAPLVSRWMERLLGQGRPPLTLAQYLALRAIEGEAPGAAELARRTGVSGPAVSQLIATLADQGLVERRAVASDRRRQQLALTRGGRDALRAATKRMRAELGALVTELPRPEADALARALPQVEALLSGTAPPRRPPPPPRP